MKKIICFSYTQDGAELSKKLNHEINSGKEISFEGYAPERYCLAAGGLLKSLDGAGAEFYGQAFHTTDALIFIGATGIAVRKIAPFIDRKESDPAVIVIDDQGRFVIPLLSGHIGGANALAKKLAGILNGIPVITTATDIHGKFAVDSWAMENELTIADVKMVKKISSAILEGKPVGFTCDFPQLGTAPSQLKPEGDYQYGICISMEPDKQPYKYTLNLIPKCIVVGMGCRKGIFFDSAEDLFLDTLKEFKIHTEALWAIATIDLKAQEPAFIQLCEKYRIRLITYSAMELSALEGGFTASKFVREVTGVDNVCERAAALSATGGEILCQKRSSKGVTIALARRKFTVRW